MNKIDKTLDMSDVRVGDTIELLEDYQDDNNYLREGQILPIEEIYDYGIDRNIEPWLDEPYFCNVTLVFSQATFGIHERQINYPERYARALL